MNSMGQIAANYDQTAAASARSQSAFGGSIMDSVYWTVSAADLHAAT